MTHDEIRALCDELDALLNTQGINFAAMAPEPVKKLLSDVSELLQENEDLKETVEIVLKREDKLACENDELWERITKLKQEMAERVEAAYKEGHSTGNLTNFRVTTAQEIIRYEKSREGDWKASVTYWKENGQKDERSI